MTNTNEILPNAAAESVGILQTLSAARDTLVSHPLFALGFLLFFGYLLGKLAAKVKLPEITGFIIAGLLMGESVLGFVPSHMGESLTTITEVALGLIALTIGGEFYWVKLKRLGGSIVVITLFQIFLAFALVTVFLTVFGMPLAFSLMLGAIASATAPAATVAIVQSLRARGAFIDYLYGVVALDDAGSVILFGVMFAMASGLLNVSGAHGGGHVIIEAFLEVIYSITIGVASGFLMHTFTKNKHGSNEIMIVVIGIFFISTGISVLFHLSPLMMNMAAGAVLINLAPRNHRIFRIIEPLTPPIYALFFVIAGTELNPSILMQREILILGSIYILARAVGKYGGVFLGCAATRTPKPIRNNLGLCMLPQAGVAIGLVLLIQAAPLTALLGEADKLIVDQMVNIVLFSVCINELIGPPISKLGILRGNEMEVT